MWAKQSVLGDKLQIALNTSQDPCRILPQARPKEATFCSALSSENEVLSYWKVHSLVGKNRRKSCGLQIIFLFPGCLILTGWLHCL